MPRSEHFLDKASAPSVCDVLTVPKFWSLGTVNMMTELMEKRIAYVKVSDRRNAEHPRLRPFDHLVNKYFDPRPLSLVASVI